VTADQSHRTQGPTATSLACCVLDATFLNFGVAEIWRPVVCTGRGMGNTAMKDSLGLSEESLDGSELGTSRVLAPPISTYICGATHGNTRFRFDAVPTAIPNYDFVGFDLVGVVRRGFASFGMANRLHLQDHSLIP
jgi:hypothetical protein